MATRPSKQDTGARRPAPVPGDEVVDPRWLLKALAGVLGVALLFGYLALCYLIYQGSWQMFLHPSQAVAQNPGNGGLAFDPVRFDSGATGVPRLSAWWIPAGQPTETTLLYLHGGSGSLADTVPELTALHGAGVNLFAIDYRGFGASASQRPNEQRMREDAEAALTYLTATRHLSPGKIIPAGSGLGAALAVSLGQAHPELPGVVVDNPDPNAWERAVRDTRSRLLPVRLLIKDRFEILEPLEKLQRPKLLIVGGPADKNPALDNEKRAAFQAAASPKFLLSVPPGDQATAQLSKAVSRFADEATR